MSYDDAPTLRPRLQTLLAAALEGDHDLAGADPSAAVVRSDQATLRRLDALRQVVLPGRRVLDLGAGLGDLARAARRHGAELVDAIDRDAEQIQLARLLCVLQGVDRVSWFEGDAGLASTYADEYDVILAFGPVLEAMRPILPRVAQNLRGVLLAELPGDGADPSGEALAAVLSARRVLVDPGEDGIAVVACASEAAVLRQQLGATEAIA